MEKLLSGLYFTETGRTRFNDWLESVAKPSVSYDATALEALYRIEDQVGMGDENPVYELSQQFTATGRPELFFAAPDDIEVVWEDDDA